MKAKTDKAGVLIVEDHAVVREGFVALVNREKDLEVCAETGSAPQALTLIDTNAPDVVVVDLVLREGDGLELIKAIHSTHPRLPILVVSMQDEEIYAERALRAGARGYVMKSLATAEFLGAIRTVLRGEFYLSSKMYSRILSDFVSGSKGPAPGPAGQLTDRELEIFTLIGSGCPTRDIASRLGISFKTVEAHRQNIKQKLGLHDAAALLQAATRWVQESMGQPGAKPTVGDS